MKIRVQPSPTAVKMVELLGANPTPIAFGELYTALPNTVIRIKKPFTLKFQTASVKYKPSFPTASTRFIRAANGLKRKI